jgi:hypothetical protein
MQKLVRRALDKVLQADVIAIGKCRLVFDHHGWWGEVVFLLVGVDQEHLNRAFAKARFCDEDHVWIRPVTDSETRLGAIFRNPKSKIPASLGSEKSKFAQRRVARWHRANRFENLLFRYGCDRHFGLLNKKPRQVVAKVKKKRPYPHWLTDYMFGSDWRYERGLY